MRFASLPAQIASNPRRLKSNCTYTHSISVPTTALASALVEEVGPVPAIVDRAKFEREVFEKGLQFAGLDAYFGWGPWTSYIINSGTMSWGGDHPVSGLHAENFSLATRSLPKVRGDTLVVTFSSGERDQLRQRFLDNLHRGPVIVWTPYAGALDATVENRWHHVSWKQLPNGEAATVPFNPAFTHAVTVFKRENDETVFVADCSVRNGAFVTDPDTVVATAAAMSASIRISNNDGSSIFSRGLKGVTGERV